jgi:hypothetical protein
MVVARAPLEPRAAEQLAPARGARVAPYVGGQRLEERFGKPERMRVLG